jgi:AraC-like DNA-binding protein
MSLAYSDTGPRVWANSRAQDVRYIPMPRVQAARLYHRAVKRIILLEHIRAWAKPNRRSSPRHTVERVLRALLFDFLNYATGRLDPSYAAIAQRAGCSLRTAKRAVAYLARIKILSWLRRCHVAPGKDGRYELVQDTNAYWFNSPGQWSPANEADPPSPPPRDTAGLQLELSGFQNPSPNDQVQSWLDAMPPNTTLEDIATNLDALATMNEARAPRDGYLATTIARRQRSQAAEIRAIDAVVRLALALMRTVH